jgi:hypothetical protein
MAEATAQNAGCSCQCENNLQRTNLLGTYLFNPKEFFFLLERAMFFVAWVWCQFAKFKTRA